MTDNAKFRFGDRVIAENWGPNHIGVVVDVDGGPKDRPVIVCFPGCTHKFCHAADELKLAPPAAASWQMVAGDGFKERLNARISDYSNYLLHGQSSRWMEARAAIDALLSEVVELPEPIPCEVIRRKVPTASWIKFEAENGRCIASCRDEDALPIAAALIRAARGEGKTPGAE